MTGNPPINEAIQSDFDIVIQLFPANWVAESAMKPTIVGMAGRCGIEAAWSLGRQAICATLIGFGLCARKYPSQLSLGHRRPRWARCGRRMARDERCHGG